MFSTNLKRSVATLGVVAGLLAAAGPASARDRPRRPGQRPAGAGHRPQGGQSEGLQ